MPAPFDKKTVFITGSTRGIGRAIAMRLAQDGANVVITGKTVEPHATLAGTIHSVTQEITEQGGSALALPLDVRDDKMITRAVQQAADHFGGIDILINNASAIALRGTERMSLSRFDLLMDVNVRGTFACSRACIPYLKNSPNPHILNIAPPLNMDPKWFKDHLVYTYSKYGMSICTLGMAEEFREQGIAVNSLWPKTTIATAAIEVHFPPEIYQSSRHPSIMADAAHTILLRKSQQTTGNFFIDESILRESGITDFSPYAINPNTKPTPDFFLE